MKIKLVSDRHDDQVIERVFVEEPDKSLRLAGTLVFQVGEWQDFGAALLLGARLMHGRVTVECVGDDQVVEDRT